MRRGRGRCWWCLWRWRAGRGFRLGRFWGGERWLWGVLDVVAFGIGVRVTFAGRLGGELSPKVVDLFLRLSRASSVVAGWEDDGHLGHDPPPHRAVDRTVGIRRHCFSPFTTPGRVLNQSVDSTATQVASRECARQKSNRDKQQQKSQRQREKRLGPQAADHSLAAHHRSLYISERHRIVESHQPNTSEGGSLGAQRSATGTRRRSYETPP